MNYRKFYLTIILLLNILTSFSQEDIAAKRITISFEHEELEQVFQTIEEKYGVSFAFANNIGKMKVSGHYSDEPLINILDKIASDLGLEYKIVGGQIAFKNKNAAQPKQKVKGKVYDEHTRMGLPGATIRLTGDLASGTITDTEGSFVLENLPVGRHGLEISFIGYRTRIEDNILLTAGKEVTLSIGMIEDVSKLEEVVVSGYKNQVVPTNQMAVVSARSISEEETQRFAGSLSDPARMALSYAGVTTSNGYTNEIIVRGNSPRGLLWRLEGIEVPNPNHYAVEGSSGGFINILNSNNMARSDFFMSAFPAEYGNATSGIFDLRMRKGNSDTREHMLELSTLGLRASTEGPIGKNKGSYLVNYRYSTLGLLDNVMDGYDFPVFQDATFKVNLPVGNNSTFSVFGLAGAGTWDEESSVMYADSAREVFRNWYDKQLYNVGIFGATHQVSLRNNKTFIESVIAASATQNRPSSSDFNYALMEPYLQERGEFVNSAYRIASTVHHKFNAQHLLTGGVKLNYLSFDLESERGFPDGTITRELEKNGNAGLVQGFASWQFKPSDYWIINSGLHVTYFSLSKQILPEPRLGIEHIVSNNQSLAIGFGMHNRHESLATYYGEYTDNDQIVRPNEGLLLSRSAHAVLAYNLSFTKNFHLKAEAYLQRQFDVPVENDVHSSYSSVNADVSFTTKDLVNEGVGRNYGVELTLEKNYARQFYFLITCSIFDAKYKALDGVWRNTRYNVNHAVNVIGGKEFRLSAKKIRSLGANVRGAWTGGKRVTPLDLSQSIAMGYEVEIPALAFTKKLKDYHRLDFSLYYKWEGKKISHQLSADILNLLEQNIYGIRYVQAKFNQPARIQEYSFNEEDEKTSNLFFIVGYKVNF